MYHPQKNFQDERNKQVIGSSFLLFYLKPASPMGLLFTLVEWLYSTTYHGSTTINSFEEVYGQLPLLVISFLVGISKL